ncbi:hypothetical protein B0H16DRAFT_627790 [Mycena metata]|uniref:DUF6534 domain-containing protein n=1 Tax=Mycena metata TaxID=1033252 RepID=A0AAD7KAL9_9AGAR|nr:hypothetical protein B0H16DRAFT_627790 [Mycena metata]
MAAFPLNLTLGPIIIGAFFSVFFFGLICMQTINYLKKFPKDIFLIKCTVISMWVLELAYTACVCQGAYTMSVTDFGQVFTLLYTPWGLNLAVVFGSIIDHGVQTFFVARIYKVTGALYVSIFLWLCVAFLQAVSLTLAAEAIRSDSIPLVGEKWNWLLTLLFFGDAALDIINACVLCFYLRIQSRSAFKSTAVLIDRWVVYTIQTGLTTSVVALGAAIAFRVAPEDCEYQTYCQYQYHSFSPDIWTAFFMSMPGSFMSALLANLNNRKSLSQASSAVTSSANSHGLAQGVTVSRSIMFSRDDDTDHPVGATKSDADVGDNSIELAKIPGIYGTRSV